MSRCASCDEALWLHDEDAAGADAEIPDDLLLPCGCHFHWQVPPAGPLVNPECLLEQAASVVSALRCPSCERSLAATGGASSSAAGAAGADVQILTRYRNEGGLQENYDIYPDLVEEAYLQAHPAARRARAFLALCGNGDVEALLRLVRDDDAGSDDDGDDDGAERMDAAALLWYQDPLADGRSGLHTAVENNQVDVAFLLLYLASSFPLEAFPPEVRAAADQMRLQRLDPASLGRPDIRALQTARGETAEAFARRQGGTWAAWASAGVFSAGGPR